MIRGVILYATLYPRWLSLTKHKMYRNYFKLVIILLPLCLVSCKKESTSVSEAIIGTWELRTEYSGWVPAKSFAPGNGNYLKFTKATYQIDTNHVLLRSGTYSIVKEKFNLTGKMGNRIIYNGEEYGNRTFVDVVHDSLTLSEDAADGGGALYIRIQ